MSKNELANKVLEVEPVTPKTYAQLATELQADPVAWARFCEDGWRYDHIELNRARKVNYRLWIALAGSTTIIIAVLICVFPFSS